MINILKSTKRSLFLFCIVFTVATLVSCILNLLLGYTIDTYAHILDRAALSLIGCIVLVIILDLKIKNGVLRFLIPYIIFMSLAFLYVFASGFFVELHPNAYRDVFLNDTIAYIVVYIGLIIYRKVKVKTKLRNVHENELTH